MYSHLCCLCTSRIGVKPVSRHFEQAPIMKRPPIPPPVTWRRSAHSRARQIAKHHCYHPHRWCRSVRRQREGGGEREGESKRESERDREREPCPNTTSRAYQHEAERRREEATQHQAAGPAEDRPDQPPRGHRADLVPGGEGAAALLSAQLVQLDLRLAGLGATARKGRVSAKARKR